MIKKFSEISGKYKGQNAILLMGGSSVLPHLKKIKNFNGSRNKIIVDCKAITPELIKSKIKIDFILCPYPEKIQDNVFQSYALRSFCAKINMGLYIKKKYQKELNYLKKNFIKFYESWRPHKGQHKNFRLKKNVYLKDSPFYLFPKLKNARLIISLKDYKKKFTNIEILNKTYEIKINNKNKFNLKEYLNPKIIKNVLQLGSYNYLNSGAMVTIPVLKKLGFEKIYFFGLDMNMLGTMEYSAPKIFKSFFHFLVFFFKCRKSFNANFKLNLPFFYLRPKSEFEDFNNIFAKFNKGIYNVSEGTIMTGAIRNLKSISYKQIFRTINDKN